MERDTITFMGKYTFFEWLNIIKERHNDCVAFSMEGINIYLLAA